MQAAQEQAALHQAQGLNNRGYFEVPKPTVSSAHEAVAALKRRAETLRAQLLNVDVLRAELTKVERMLAAAEEP